MSIYKRLLFTALCLAMASFSVLQVNDPDPLLWVAIYALAAMLFAAAACGWSHTWATLAIMALMALLAATVAPGFLDWALNHGFESIIGTMSDDKPFIEETRELLGLVIALACLAILLRWPPVHRPPADGSKRST